MWTPNRIGGRVWSCLVYTSIGKFRSDDAKTGDILALVGSTSGAAYFPSAVTMADGNAYPVESAVYPLPNFEGAEACAVQPVSYTHLDVYKRQPPGIPPGLR